MTEEKIQEKVFQNSLNTCDYIEGYENCSSIIKVKCRKHNYEFKTKQENVRRNNRPHHICPKCQEEDIAKKYIDNRTVVKCAFCNKNFLKPNSKLDSSKSGLYFCCREHKDLAQKVDSGEKFQKMRPEHYGNGTSDYREKAFQYYNNECAICKYKEEINILQVHHIDENRQNNNIDNLIILCPNCHAKITYGKYKLINRDTLLKESS